MPYQNKSWVLKDNYLYVAIGNNPSSMKGKILEDKPKGKSFTPTNDAAYMMLYLLCRDCKNGDDALHFDQLVEFVQNQFITTGWPDAEAKVTAFLKDIDNFIKQKPANKPIDPDPCNFYPDIPSKKPWPPGPYLKPAKPAEKKKQTIHYSTGYVCICYRP